MPQRRASVAAFIAVCNLDAVAVQAGKSKGCVSDPKTNRRLLRENYKKVMPSSRLKTTAAVWGGVGLAAVTIRALKRWRSRKREERIAKQGGRLPDCPTVVHALAKRAERRPMI